MRKLVVILFVFIMLVQAKAQPYKDPDLPVDARVKDLLSRMTPEEKFWQMFMIPGDLSHEKERYKTGIFGFQVSTVGQNAEAAGQMLSYAAGASAIETAEMVNQMQHFFLEESRLGIPIIPFDEALHGLVRRGATAFPQSIALAATWDTQLMHQVSKAIATECKTRGIRQILSPVVNVASDVRWGRTEETYGEDPFLTSEMGVAFVSEFEKMGVITTPKHYIANVGDGGRDSYPIHWNERLLREIYLPPFEACFKRGGSRSVMTSYNSLDGSPCTTNDWLLNQILKKEWGFKGFVISDAGATGGANVLHFTAKDYPESTAKSVTSGLDVIFQTSYDHYKLFSPPFYDGSIDQQTIDNAVSRILKLKFELGLFENPYVDAKAAGEWNGYPAHRQLAKEAAQKSVVLLKNEKQTLPLSKTIKSVTVIGADATEARLGGYSGPGIDPVSILDGIKNKLSNQTEVRYAKGCDRENIEYVTVGSDFLSCTTSGKTQKGLNGEYFNNVTLTGKPVFTRVDPQVQFQWTLFSPDPEKLTYDFYSVRWTGKLKAPASGNYKIGIDGNDGYRLYLNDKLLIDNWQKLSKQTILADFSFEKDKEYNIRIEYYEPVGNAFFRLIWNVNVNNNQKEEINNAAELAAKSDVAVLVVGIEEGEFRDRAYLNLPGRQEELINKVAATGTPVVVVLLGGSAITMNNWLKNVPVVIDVWYPGDEGGNAVADVLFGDYSPAGRLPITFPVFEGQLPLVYNHKPTGRGDDYNNLTGHPLFPFGYGLSYTTFDYTDLQIEKNNISASDSTVVRCKITNTGKVAGDEVVQLYIRDELASVARPVTELKGFQRIHLNSGETKEVSFLINPEMLSMLDIEMKKVVEPGEFRIMIGASSKDIRLKGVLTVDYNP
ncbi:glycoside hydrolase family 3 N-terminal domain-containing protein [Gaoshiqia sp. Z1-71]|uniref:glycoside hydrolase family 3 N-terminal domain-containing protein n=1 Tax=Gaoshiqia hydrogeniformans TaxID=3290090 RepID=UPI003BF8A13B